MDGYFSASIDMIMWFFAFCSKLKTTFIIYNWIGWFLHLCSYCQGLWVITRAEVSPISYIRHLGKVNRETDSPKHPHPSLWHLWICYPNHGKSLTLQMWLRTLRRGDYTGLLGWAQSNHRALVRNTYKKIYRRISL